MKETPLFIKEFKVKEHEYLIPELTSILHESYGVLAKQGMKYLASHQPNEKTLDRLMQGRSYFGFCDRELVSTITLRLDTPDAPIGFYRSKEVGLLTQFAVRLSHQDSGFGKQMMDFAESKAIELGVEYLSLDTSENAHRLISMYRKRGYLIVDEHDWDFTNYKSVVMSKKLF
jgi:ribosomal protein S18 acetylase RimI-like enzyme